MITIKTWNIDQLCEYEPQPGYNLIGEGVLTKGSTMVIAGPPGVGKSLATSQLALSGVTGEPFFGLEIKHPYNTLLLQSENSLARLSREARALPDRDDYGNRILYAERPARGFRFSDHNFVANLQRIIQDASVGVVVIDPLNSVCPNLSLEGFLECFAVIRQAVGVGDDAPALLFIHHTRKSLGSGGALQHDVSGSYAISSVARSVFCLLPVGDSVSWSCAMLNDAQKPATSYWRINDLRFEPIEMEEVASAKDPQDTAKKDILSMLSKGPMTRKELLIALQGRLDIGRTTLYKYVAEMVEDGRVVDDKGSLSILLKDDETIRPSEKPKREDRTDESKGEDVSDLGLPSDVRPPKTPKATGRTDDSLGSDQDTDQLGLGL
ncbi:AAA family ATPase [Pelagicoccus sp. SDUM812003]|uniref:AAA family ATPase n=1 Tax=Pelagicoccus sp. SDUM812003 TaxID=3041267 RepID=UPI00280FFEC2|nr:AAA family ATPase [Pelagicoccus sp. SDUM812003]MDQ8203336.1 AAA family ATPase [Pelagicoccus sp. SDUM812003]